MEEGIHAKWAEDVPAARWLGLGCGASEIPLSLGFWVMSNALGCQRSLVSSSSPPYHPERLSLGQMTLLWEDA